MKLIRNVNAFQSPHNTIVAIGNFDAIHRGHQYLLEKLSRIAKEQGLIPTVITFEPLPPEFFSTDPPARLCSFKEKWLHFKKWGIKQVLCLRFNAKLAALSAKDFVDQILVTQLKTKHVIIGEDFRFGHRRQGDITLLKDLGEQHHFKVDALPVVNEDTQRVSSTLVRKYLAEGNLNEVQVLLNRPFSLSGHVSYGNQRGRQLGFPTANIRLRRKKMPVQGVFIVRVHGMGDSPLPGVANVGNRPTVDGHTAPLLEVHLLDFNGSLYGRFLTVEFIKKIRDEKRFASLTALKAQIQRDATETRHFFKKF